MFSHLRVLHPFLRVCTVVHRLPADSPRLIASDSRAFHCSLTGTRTSTRQKFLHILTGNVSPLRSQRVMIV